MFSWCELPSRLKRQESGRACRCGADVGHAAHVQVSRWVWSHRRRNRRSSGRRGPACCAWVVRHHQVVPTARTLRSQSGNWWLCRRGPCHHLEWLACPMASSRDRRCRISPGWGRTPSELGSCLPRDSSPGHPIQLWVQGCLTQAEGGRPDICGNRPCQTCPRQIWPNSGRSTRLQVAVAGRTAQHRDNAKRLCTRANVQAGR